MIIGGVGYSAYQNCQNTAFKAKGFRNVTERLGETPDDNITPKELETWAKEIKRASVAEIKGAKLYSFADPDAESRAADRPVEEGGKCILESYDFHDYPTITGNITMGNKYGTQNKSLGIHLQIKPTRDNKSTPRPYFEITTFNGSNKLDKANSESKTARIMIGEDRKLDNAAWEILQNLSNRAGNSLSDKDIAYLKNECDMQKRRAGSYF